MKFLFFLLSLVFIPIYLEAQNLTNIDYVSPFNEGLAAVKRGKQWAFIDTEGTLVIDFRDDLVETKTGDDYYPIFKNERCLIMQKREDISYFGYIDKNGVTVIKPIFLNATNFNRDYALALKLIKENLGKNHLLDMEVYRYKYYEVLINKQGEILSFLFPKEPVTITLEKSKLLKPPKITSRLISDQVFLKQSSNNKWEIVKI